MKRTRLPILFAVLMLAAAILACSRPASTQPARPPTSTSAPAAAAHMLDLYTLCTLDGKQELWLLVNRTSNTETFSYTLDGGEGSGGVVRGFEIQGFLLTPSGEHTVSVDFAGIQDSLSADGSMCESVAATMEPILAQPACLAVMTTPAPEGSPAPEQTPQACAADAFTLAYRCIPDTGKMEWTVEARGEGRATWILDGQLDGGINLPDPGEAVPLMVLPGGQHTVELQGKQGGRVVLSSLPGECAP